MSNTLSTREKLDDLYTLKIGLSNVQWIVQMHIINEEGQKYVNILNKYGLNQLSEKITSYSQSKLTLEERTQLKEDLLVDIETSNNTLTKIINGLDVVLSDELITEINKLYKKFPITF